MADTEKLIKKCDFCGSEYIILAEQLNTLIVVQHGEHQRYDMCGTCARKASQFVGQMRKPIEHPVEIIAIGER